MDNCGLFAVVLWMSCDLVKTSHPTIFKDHKSTLEGANYIITENYFPTPFSSIYDFPDDDVDWGPDNVPLYVPSESNVPVYRSKFSQGHQDQHTKVKGQEEGLEFGGKYTESNDKGLRNKGRVNYPELEVELPSEFSQYQIPIPTKYVRAGAVNYQLIAPHLYPRTSQDEPPTKLHSLQVEELKDEEWKLLFHNLSSPTRSEEAQREVANKHQVDDNVVVNKQVGRFPTSIWESKQRPDVSQSHHLHRNREYAAGALKSITEEQIYVSKRPGPSLLPTVHLTGHIDEVRDISNSRNFLAQSDSHGPRGKASEAAPPSPSGSSPKGRNFHGEEDIIYPFYSQKLNIKVETASTDTNYSKNPTSSPNHFITKPQVESPTPKGKAKPKYIDVSIKGNEPHKRYKTYLRPEDPEASATSQFSSIQRVGYPDQVRGYPSSHTNYISQYPKYDYTWEVLDSASGNNFGHGEKRDGEETMGEYRTLLPDGRVQLVRYNVHGDDGYVAEVLYS